MPPAADCRRCNRRDDAADSRGAFMAVVRKAEDGVLNGVGLSAPASTVYFRSDVVPGAPPMANAFDPYREALVVENHTIWSADCEDWSAADKARL